MKIVKKILRYIVNTIVCLIIWFLIFSLWMITVNESPSSLFSPFQSSLVVGIMFLIALTITRQINHSKLWINIFKHMEPKDTIIIKNEEDGGEEVFSVKEVSTGKIKKITNSEWKKIVKKGEANLYKVIYE